MPTIDNIKSYSRVLTPIVAVASLFVAIVGAVIQNYQFNQRYIADLRPWLAVRPVVKEIYISYGRLSSATIDFSITNHGKLPGLKVEVIVGGWTEVYEQEKTKNACVDASKATYDVRWQKAVVLPDETITLPVHPDLSSTSTVPSDVTLIGCVVYRSTVDNYNHETTFSYDLNIKNSADIKYDFSGAVYDKDVVIEPSTFSDFITAN